MLPFPRRPVTILFGHGIPDPPRVRAIHRDSKPVFEAIVSTNGGSAIAVGNFLALHGEALSDLWNERLVHDGEGELVELRTSPSDLEETYAALADEMAKAEEVPYTIFPYPSAS